jgi:hypothetical protein
MVSLPIAQSEIPSEIRTLLRSLAAAAVVTALADWLFYLHRPGISIVIFSVALAAAALATNKIRASRAELTLATAVLIAALLPAIEDFGLLALAFAGAGSAAFVLLAAGWQARSGVERLRDLGWMVVSGPARLVADLRSVVQVAHERELGKHGANWLAAWIVPVVLGGVFLLLLLQANPLIEQWLTNVGGPSWKLDLVRPLFWVAVVTLVWPFLRVELWSRPVAQAVLAALGALFAIESALDAALGAPPPPAPAAVPSAAAAPAAAGPVFGMSAILRSLFLFNALFAVESALDIAYLWGGVALPAGMSYAAYAHRGAFPLMVSALLAGGFVLAAMQPGTLVERSRLVRALVYLWIGQTVLLVASAMLRLYLYVSVYSLTGLRCAAFIWMLVVATGLVLIVARIALGRSNSWLVWGNVAALTLTLYGCSLVDFPALIANFNVAHSREISGTGTPVDVAYLCTLGPTALPAIEQLAKANVDGRLAPDELTACRFRLAARHEERMQDWRAWTFRGYRLMRQLERTDSPLATDPHWSLG